VYLTAQHRLCLFVISATFISFGIAFCYSNFYGLKTGHFLNLTANYKNFNYAHISLVLMAIFYVNLG